MSRHKKKSGIPDRWLDYTAVGKRLHGTRFIAFKVPLNQSFNQEISRSDVFGPWELLDIVKKENQELGLIIDLTFTTRYYTLQDLPESLRFVKIFTAGHEVPSDDTILSFKRAVRRFLRDNRDNDKLIGVHCTHGLNRTGYLICRYLIDVDGMNPTSAVRLFNSSRGHCIERQNYLRDLHCGPKRSNKGMEKCEQEPQRGCAVRQPCLTPPRSDNTDERPPLAGARSHRPFPPCPPPRPPRDGLLPAPSLLPSPPCLWPPVGAPFYPYQRFRPPKSATSRSRYPPPQPEWRPAPYTQQDMGRGLVPPPLPPYRPQWAKQNNGHQGPDEQEAGPRTSHRYRHTHRENRHKWF